MGKGRKKFVAPNYLSMFVGSSVSQMEKTDFPKELIIRWPLTHEQQLNEFISDLLRKDFENFHLMHVEKPWEAAVYVRLVIRDAQTLRKLLPVLMGVPTEFLRSRR